MIRTRSLDTTSLIVTPPCSFTLPLNYHWTCIVRFLIRPVRPLLTLFQQHKKTLFFGILSFLKMCVHNSRAQRLSTEWFLLPFCALKYQVWCYYEWVLNFGSRNDKTGSIKNNDLIRRFKLLICVRYKFKRQKAFAGHFHSPFHSLLLNSIF